MAIQLCDGCVPGGKITAGRILREKIHGGEIPVGNYFIVLRSRDWQYYAVTELSEVDLINLHGGDPAFK